jgi:hypothetical protein
MAEEADRFTRPASTPGSCVATGGETAFPPSISELPFNVMRPAEASLAMPIQEAGRFIRPAANPGSRVTTSRKIRNGGP